MRTLGGAVAPHPEATWHEKEHTHQHAKELIARRALDLIHPGTLILLDAGTTTAALAGCLADRTDITLATYGLSSALAVADGTVELLADHSKLEKARPPYDYFSGLQPGVGIVTDAVRSPRRDRTVEALRAAGHTVLEA